MILYLRYSTIKIIVIINHFKLKTVLSHVKFLILSAEDDLEEFSHVNHYLTIIIYSCGKPQHSAKPKALNFCKVNMGFFPIRQCSIEYLANLIKLCLLVFE